MAHTPGPWKTRSPASFLVEAGSLRIIQQADHLAGREDELHANARLIAAAPELLAAAKSALDLVEASFAHLAYGTYDDPETAIVAKQLESAINKATK